LGEERGFAAEAAAATLPFLSKAMAFVAVVLQSMPTTRFFPAD